MGTRHCDRQGWPCPQSLLSLLGDNVLPTLTTLLEARILGPQPSPVGAHPVPPSDWGTPPEGERLCAKL